MKCYGIDVDKATRCYHYHQNWDVVALKCAFCQQYFACYKCHDQLRDHQFVATDLSDVSPVLCGSCKTIMSRDDYKQGACPSCRHLFNPNCQKHAQIYFQGDS